MPICPNCRTGYDNSAQCPKCGTAAPERVEPKPNSTPDVKPPDRNGSDVMKMIHKLLVMAVRHCHTFKRWTTIWNLFIEKDLGNPQIDRLRTLHIIEADYNLLLKWFGPQGVLKHAESHQQITDNQGGCQKGRSAIDLACKKVCTFQLIRLLHYIAANVDIDALACFDMMIEACQNLSCLSHGADPRYIRLHGQTHRHTRYYPKHSYGVSEQCNTYSDEHPWYGAGQGTGDAAIRWTLISHSLITAYQSEATPWRLKSTIRDVLITLGIDAFVDDTNMIHGDDGETVIKIVQNNFHIWQDLLHASSGTLNPLKCS